MTTREIRSKVMANYNRANAVMRWRISVNSPCAFEPRRLHRALGIAMSERLWVRMLTRYHTKMNFCGCSDNAWRGDTAGVWCKHRVAYALRNTTVYCIPREMREERKGENAHQFVRNPQ